jgi:hypothetical protein
MQKEKTVITEKKEIKEKLVQRIYKTLSIKKDKGAASGQETPVL